MGYFMRVLGVARRHAGWMVLAIVSMVIVAAATVFSYNLIRPIYDQLFQPTVETTIVTPPSDATGLVARLDRLVAEFQLRLQRWAGGSRASLLVLVLIAVLVKNSFTFLARYGSARYGLATIRDLRNLILDAILGQSPESLHRTTSGVLVARVTSDVQLIHEALAERFGDLIQDGLTVILLLVYLFSLDARLALATTVLIPVLLLPVVHFSRRLRSKSMQSQRRMGDMASVLSESVTGMAVIQAFSAEPQMGRRFRDASHQHFVATLKTRAIQAANGPVMELVGAAAAVGLIAYASSRIASGHMTLGDFTAFLVAVWGAYNPVKRLNKFNLALQQAVVASERVFQVIDAVPQVRDAETAVELEELGNGVRFDGVWFAYRPGQWVLQDVSIEIPRGRTVALVGPSGAGKTTLALLVPRFWDVDRGSLLVGGIDVRSFTLSSLRSRIGLVTQDTILFNDTVRNNIALARPEASRDSVEAAARAARAHDFIRALPAEYETMLGELGHGLSGGQRQRLTIARALLANPAFLVLDEATSALDPAEERLVQRAVDELMLGRTTLVIAHRLTTVRRADSIIVLDAGRIVQRGSHDELMAEAGLYRDLVEAQELAE